MSGSQEAEGADAAAVAAMEIEQVEAESPTVEVVDAVTTPHNGNSPVLFNEPVEPAEQEVSASTGPVLSNKDIEGSQELFYEAEQEPSTQLLPMAVDEQDELEKSQADEMFAELIDARPTPEPGARAPTPLLPQSKDVEMEPAGSEHPTLLPKVTEKGTEELGAEAEKTSPSTENLEEESMSASPTRKSNVSSKGISPAVTKEPTSERERIEEDGMVIDRIVSKSPRKKLFAARPSAAPSPIAISVQKTAAAPSSLKSTEQPSPHSASPFSLTESPTTRKTHVAPPKDLEPLFTKEPPRVRGVGMMYSALRVDQGGEEGEEVDVDVWRLAERIENEIFEECGKKHVNDTDPFGTGGGLPNNYKPDIRTHHLNLKNVNNTLLRARLLSGELTPSEFAKMETKDLAPPEHREVEKRIEQQGIFNALNKDLVDRAFEDQILRGDKEIKGLRETIVTEDVVERSIQAKEMAPLRVPIPAGPKTEVKDEEPKKRRGRGTKRKEVQSDAERELVVVSSSEEGGIKARRSTRKEKDKPKAKQEPVKRPTRSQKVSEEPLAKRTRSSSTKETSARKPAKPASRAPAKKTSRVEEVKKRARKEESSSESTTGYESDDEEEFEVEKILGKKEKELDGKMVTHYKIKWKNYKTMSWEPRTNLVNCDALLAEFEKSENKATKGETVKAGTRRKRQVSSEISEAEKPSDNEKAKQSEKDKEKGKGKDKDKGKGKKVVVSDESEEERPRKRTRSNANKPVESEKENSEEQEQKPVKRGKKKEQKKIPAREPSEDPVEENEKEEQLEEEEEEAQETPEPAPVEFRADEAQPSIGPSSTISQHEVIEEAVHAAEHTDGEFMGGAGGQGILGNQGKLPLSAVLSGWDEDAQREM